MQIFCMVRTVAAQVVSDRTGLAMMLTIRQKATQQKMKSHWKWFLVTGMERLKLFLNILESFIWVGDEASQRWLTFVTGEPGKNWLASGRLEALPGVLKSAHHFLSRVQSPFTQVSNSGETHSDLTPPPSRPTHSAAISVTSSPWMSCCSFEDRFIIPSSKLP